MHEKQLTLFSLSFAFAVIAVIVVGLRCVARWKIRAFGYDDYFMVAGTMTFVATAATMIVGAMAGLGVPDEFLTIPDIMTASHAFVVFEPFYVLTLIFVKLSICFTLLRIAEEKAIRWVVYFVMALSTLSGFVIFVAVLSLCRPISAAWTGEGHCASPNIIVQLAYFISVTAIITDFTCAIVPSVILYKLHMNARLKWTVAAILSLGFFASSATIIRWKYIHDYVSEVNHVEGIANICIWTIVECGLGIFAGSAPALKPLIKSFAGTLFSSSKTGTRTKQTGQYTGGSRTGGTKQHSRFNMQNLPSSLGHELQSTIVHDVDVESQKSTAPLGIMVNNEVDIESIYSPGSGTSGMKKDPSVFITEA